MKKSMYIGIVIIIFMIIIICVFAFMGNGKKQNTTVNSNAKLNEEEVLQNEQTNEQVNEQLNEQVNEVVENEQVNETTSNVETNEEENKVTSTETFEESPKTAEEKAIEIVKKDWGQNDNLEFLIEGIDENGNYIVTVRDSKNTQALAFYTVNVTSQTFSKKEMN